MFRLRLLPWEYGVRNLWRRPSRSALTIVALATVTLLILVVVGFIRGLGRSLAVSGNPSVVLVYSLGAKRNIGASSIPARAPGLLTANIEGVREQYGDPQISPEIYMGMRVDAGPEGDSRLGLVRGVTHAAPLVRQRVRLVGGTWPGPGEVMVGSLAAAKLGHKPRDLAIGKTIRFANREWTISGRFDAGGTAFDSEIWCRLPDFQRALKRQDLSSVALMLKEGASPAMVNLFCKSRTDLELQSLQETDYYRSLQKHYQPLLMLAWLVVGLVASAGVFAGLNMMYGAVAGRTREIATLRALGYRRRAILISIVQEGTLLAAGAALIAGCLGLWLVNGMAVRFTMGAFTLRIDSVSLLIGCGTGLAIGVIGSLPPAIKALRRPVAESLKAV